ncbi:MAG TPA: hypothetical protein VHB27_16625 [Rhodopila sp.]|uniref:hypothetical protein n=1 Tax=Rhodopila sp. TaxID=2480087 RepID=UPI002D1CE00F|nr:hypothetical protein [Rhodopila sp.]HVY16849.1 hypothetical protein [Rhodopila sp.]
MATALYRRRRSGNVWIVAICLVLVAPLFVCALPPLADYPNHLARAFVLSALPGDPVLNRMYAADWSVIPNLGLDLVMPPLMHWLPALTVGRLVVGAAVLLPVLGVVAYHRALRAGEAWWSLGGCLTAYAGCLLYGFLNFVLSLGLALLLAAAWLSWRETRPKATVLLAAVGAVALFTCHLMGLVFFGVLIGAAELSRLWPFRLTEALKRGGVLLLVFIVPAVLYRVSALAELGGDAQWLPWGRKLLQLETGFIAYDPWLDGLSVLIAFGVPLAALACRRGRVPPASAWAIALLAAAYLVTPYAWKGTFQIDTRLAVMLAMMMFAGFAPVDWPRWARRAGQVAIAGVFLGRMALVLLGWWDQRAVLASLRAAMAPLRPGQTVMVADASPAEAPAYWAKDPYRLRLANGVTLSAHFGALTLIERRAWWPFEFDNPSQQPMRTREPYRALALRAAELPDRTRLLTMDLSGFDDVLLTNAEAVPPLPADRFTRLAGSGFAVLYAIRDRRPD